MFFKKYLLFVTLPIALVGCNATNNINNNNEEVGWNSSTKSEVNRRLQVTENIINSPSYKVFDRKLTFSSVYSVKNEVAAMSNPNDFDVSETRYITSYSYNPDTLSFQYTYDRFFVEDNIHSIRTINITVGELNGKTILQTQQRNSQYEEYEVENFEISASNKRNELEDEIESWLFYMGLNLSYYFNNIEDYTSEYNVEAGYTLRSKSLNVDYFTKGNDGVRIQSSGTIDQYQKYAGTNNYKYELYDSSSFDVIIMNNMFVKYESSSCGTTKDYVDGSIERDTRNTSFSASETSTLGKISLIK